MVTLAELARRLKPLPRPRPMRRERNSLPRWFVLTDVDRLPDPSRLIAHLPRDTAIILRHPDRAARAHAARRLLPLCRSLRVPLLIAADPALARSLPGVGLHLPEAMLRRQPAIARRFRQAGRRVTAAAHAPAAIQRAARAGAEAVLVAPVFPTASHPDAPSLGPIRFVRMVRQSPLPVFALGGITATTARRLAGSGAAGLAAIGLFAAQSTV